MADSAKWDKPKLSSTASERRKAASSGGRARGEKNILDKYGTPRGAKALRAARMERTVKERKRRGVVASADKVRKAAKK